MSLLHPTIIAGHMSPHVQAVLLLVIGIGFILAGIPILALFSVGLGLVLILTGAIACLITLYIVLRRPPPYTVVLDTVA